MPKIYKLQDTQTGIFWSGYYRCLNTDQVGRSWKSIKGIKNGINHLINGMLHENQNWQMPNHWKIVEIEVTETIKSTIDVGDMVYHARVKQELHKKDNDRYNRYLKYNDFYDIMQKKGCVDKIQFLIELKPDTNTKYVDFKQIMVAREQLRQLGVKTHSFKEHRGIFGMLDRDQAMKARLVLNIKNFIDLEEVRNIARAANQTI
jgi:hypothetical protein